MKDNYISPFSALALIQPATEEIRFKFSMKLKKAVKYYEKNKKKRKTIKSFKKCK